MAGMIKQRPARRSRTVIEPSKASKAPPRQKARQNRFNLSRLLPQEPSRRRAPRSHAGQPPVLARRGLQAMATPLRRQKTPRRRYDLTLSVPGAEVRLPSLPAVRFSWRIASGVLVALMLLTIYAVLFSPVFQVELLEVEGLQRLTLDDLSQALGIAGEPVVSLNPMLIRQELLNAFPDLSQVKVFVGLPASVRLVITERQPLVAWSRSGETVWVDEEGVVFPQRGEAPPGLVHVEANALPLLSIPLFEDAADQSFVQDAERINPQLVNVLLAMSKYMPGSAGMVFDDQRGFGWGDERGWDVYFGPRLTDIDQKLLVYQVIVDRLQAEGIQPALISVEYLHAPYYRMEH